MTIKTAIDPRVVPKFSHGPATSFRSAPAPAASWSERGRRKPGRFWRASGTGIRRCDLRDINDDGTMARVPDLIRFSARNTGLLMITSADLQRYRLNRNCDESLKNSTRNEPCLRLRRG